MVDIINNTVSDPVHLDSDSQSLKIRPKDYFFREGERVTPAGALKCELGTKVFIVEKSSTELDVCNNRRHTVVVGGETYWGGLWDPVVAYAEGYNAYTTEFDEVVRPTDLVDERELLSLAENFHNLCPVENFEPLREKLEQLKAPSVKTMVTLLVDNSCSMRGWPITFAIGAVGIISMYLDKLGVSNEILGFTTKSWRGGEGFEKWRDSKYEPAIPGRLSPLRHIVYKEVDERLIDVRHNLALMMREGILKENIDGEAVEWACERLRSHDVERRILLVISDGAPIDDRTIASNPILKDGIGEEVGRRYGTYLSRHLTKVISDLKDAGDIQLDAIGVGHDVSKFYGVGDKIMKLEELAPVAISKLENLLRDPES